MVHSPQSNNVNIQTTIFQQIFLKGTQGVLHKNYEKGQIRAEED